MLVEIRSSRKMPVLLYHNPAGEELSGADEK